MQKISKKEAIVHGRSGVKGWYYQLPEFDRGTTVAYAEFTGEHGERVVGARGRFYYILEGKAEFMVDGTKFPVESGDVVPIAPYSVYNFWTKSKMVKILLVMELLDLEKIPKK